MIEEMRAAHVEFNPKSEMDGFADFRDENLNWWTGLRYGPVGRKAGTDKWGIKERIERV